MREVNVSEIRLAVKELFQEANYRIGRDLLDSLKECRRQEESPVGADVLDQIIENDELAARESIAVCQDTGMAVLFMEMGQEVVLTGGNWRDAVNDGVRDAYSQGYLRKSIVNDPLFQRINTGDNTPAIIHLDIVPGDKIRLDAAPKGFGSENMSALRLFKPTDGPEKIREFIVATTVEAGPNPCPPTIVGVGIGGTVEKSALLAKKALLRPVGNHHADPRYAGLEAECLEAINGSGVGPGGLGGRTTSLGVHIETFPTHIAGLPVTVNICCHACRHAHAVI